jgi:hypothetical protein
MDMIMFAGCVTNPSSAVVVNAVSASRTVPFHRATKAKSTNVMMGEKMPRAFAALSQKSLVYVIKGIEVGTVPLAL